MVHSQCMLIKEMCYSLPICFPIKSILITLSLMLFRQVLTFYCDEHEMNTHRFGFFFLFCCVIINHLLPSTRICFFKFARHCHALQSPNQSDTLPAHWSSAFGLKERDQPLFLHPNLLIVGYQDDSEVEYCDKCPCFQDCLGYGL